MIGGAIPFGFFYGISLMEAFLRTPDFETDVLAIPVLGPFMAINRADTCAGVQDHRIACKTKRDLKYVWYTFDGSIQVLGAALMTVGFAVRKRWYFRDDARVAVVPTSFGGTRTGLAVVGRF